MHFINSRLGVGLALVFLGTATPALAAERPNLALLVGCTEYPNYPRLRALYGPANDVPLWAALLTDPKGFAFPKENVIQLVGWPKEEAQRPTYANIVKGFEQLIAKAEPDSRVVIVLSGHGIQIPIPTTQKDPLDPKNPEPDGLDEVFLPADVKDWTESGLQNAILDDQVGRWLDQLRDKGAHVLIVFDCCHSGTMTRGGDEVREINRVVNPAALGITDVAIQEAVARAKKAVAEAKAAGRPVPGEVKVQEKSGRGSLVAFYAAQPFEEAPELPFPEDAPIQRENYYGMLTWTLVQTIKSRASPLTYGELQRLVAAGYRSARGTRPPTPFAEGDLSREVLGLNVWPNRSAISVQRDKKGTLQIDAGQLHGVTPNSILAVFPPPGDKQDPKTVLGYLKVTSATPSRASVVPVMRVTKQGEVEWEAASGSAVKVPNFARCEVIVQDFGDLRVKLFTNAGSVNTALERLDASIKGLLRLVPKEAEADWILRVVTPEDANKEYGISGLAGDHVFLVHGEGKARLPTDKTPTEGSKARPRKVFGQYPLANEKALIGALERDLPKIFKWENLWRVAGGMSMAEGGTTHGLVLEVLKLKDENDTKGEPLRDGVLRDGQEVLFRARNSGSEPLWVTVFYLDANLGIEEKYSLGVNGGQTVKLFQATMTTEGGSTGLEGLVVFAVPQAVVPVRPNFSMMEQEPLRVAEAIRRGPGDAPEGPFGKLLSQAAFHKGTKGVRTRVPSTPAIISQSWVLVP